MNEEENIYSIKIGDKTFYLGGLCPPIESVFFPIEKENKEGDPDDSAQSS